MQDSAATTIQNWWRLMDQFRCHRCGDFYKGNIMCDPCYWRRHHEVIPDDVWYSFWEDLEKEEEERKRKNQEKKKALGLIK